MSSNIPLSTLFPDSPVIMAYDHYNERPVALKIRDDFMCQLPAFYDVILEEASKWQALNHSNIVKIYEESSLGGIYYLAMEYLNGSSLRDHILKQGPLGIHETMRILLPALNAAHFLHRRGVQHRRILAKNIFLTTEGRVVLLDFGISHAFDNYCEVHAEKLWVRHWADALPLNDIMGFGVIMIQCLTGLKSLNTERHIYPGQPIDMLVNYEECYNNFLKQFNSPQWLSKVLYKAIFQQENSRYENIGDMIHDLEQVMN